MQTLSPQTPNTPWTSAYHTPYRTPYPSDPDDGGTTLLTKILIGSLIAAVIVPVIVVLWLYMTYRNLVSGSLPSERPGLESQITRIYDDAGNQIAILRNYDTSIPVQPEDIPTILKQAVVAVEDRRFYSHDGVDNRAILRALWADINGGGYIEGASTITQQYVRLVYIDNEKTIKRKLREAALARRVEKELTKDEILYRYLSRVYLGGGAYGVGAASQAYFRKPVNDLTLSEAALLAGLIRAPSVNEPRENSVGADSVRQIVLDRMVQQGRITAEEHQRASQEHVFLLDENSGPAPEGPVTIVHPHLDQNAAYPYFVDYVRRYLVAKYGDDRVYQGGLQVETSLNPSLQAKAEAAVKETLSGTSAPLEMSLVSLDPRTGAVRALVGGRDFSKSQVNLALGACGNVIAAANEVPRCIDGGGSGRQPGSAFKPITLAKALEKGMSPTKAYSGPGTYTFPNCTRDCTVKNVESGGYGSITLRQATAYSVNTVFAQLVVDVGVKDTAEMAHRLGLTMVNTDGNLVPTQPYGPSLTLGAAETSPLDMAAAFGVFANRGEQQPAVPVLRVKTASGEVLEDNTRRPGKRIVSQYIADTMNDVLGDVIDYGTGRGADIGRPDGTAGKTGTSENFADAWFVGYTPQLSTAVWMGYADGRKPLQNIKGYNPVYGGTLPALTWKKFMTDATPELNLTDFSKPVAPVVTPPPALGRTPSPSQSPAPTSTPTTSRGPVPSTPPSTAPPRTTTTFPPLATLPPRPTTTTKTTPTTVFLPFNRTNP